MALITEGLEKKWESVLDHSKIAPIKDSHKRFVTAVILENQVEDMKKSGLITEAPTNVVGDGGYSGTATAGGPVAGFDPILISLVRRSLPNLIAYDVCGVQPMTGPTGLIFAMRSTYGTSRTAANEAFYNEANTAHAGTGTHSTLAVANTALTTNTFSGLVTGSGLPTSVAEDLTFNEMGFSIEKVAVTAKTRALKAEYSIELAQDLKAIHGLEAESELSKILSSEILVEINREVIRNIYNVSKIGAQNGTTTAGTFDLDTDSNGRWFVERVKGLTFQIEREANAIAKLTRRGKGNIMIVSSDVASAFAVSGYLDYNSALKSQIDLTVDDTGNTYAGNLFGRIKVFIDPYSAISSALEFAVVGYKGPNPYDNGIFYCPYVPLQMVRAVDSNNFQPKIGFKTRYGLVANPFAGGLTQGQGALTPQSNVYYRSIKIANLM